LIASYRLAVQHEKKANAIFVQSLGAKHARVEESKAWLAQFTSNAVNFEQGQHQKIVQPDVSQLGSQFSWILSGYQPRVQKQKITVADLVKYLQMQGNEEASSKILKSIEKQLSVQKQEQPEESPVETEGNEESTAEPASITKSSKRRQRKRRTQSRKSVELERAEA
jgi:hypothetical protein